MRLFFEVTQDAASKMVSTDATHGLRVINYAAAATAVDAATAVKVCRGCGSSTQRLIRLITGTSH